MKSVKDKILLVIIGIVFSSPLYAQSTKNLLTAANGKLPGVSKTGVVTLSKKSAAGTKMSFEDPNLAMHLGADGGQMMVEEDKVLFSGERLDSTVEGIVSSESMTGAGSK